MNSLLAVCKVCSQASTGSRPESRAQVIHGAMLICVLNHISEDYKLSPVILLFLR